MAGDEWWIGYQELELTEDDLKLRLDHFWYKVFSKADPVGEQFAILLKMLKYALLLCHSNANM